MNQQNLAQFNLGISQLMPCVICYVPGSGVNKLKQVLSKDFDLQPKTHGSPQLTQFLKTQSNEKPTLNFAGQVRSVEPKVRPPGSPPYELWPLSTQIDLIEPCPCDRSVVVSHCMSASLIQHQFPGRRIIKIFGNFMLALKRWHVTYGQYQNSPSPIVHNRWRPWLDIFQKHANQLYIAHQIFFFLDYYQQHWDRDCDFFVDISQNDCYFSNFMMADYQRCEDTDFDKVCEVLRQSPEVQDILRCFA